MPRPRFVPTEEQRRAAKSLSAYGIKQKDIARMFGLRSPKTLRRHLHEELDRGAIEATAQVGQTLFKMATSGQHPAATIFWLKTRAGWREVQILETQPVDDPQSPAKRQVSRIVWRAAERPKPPDPPEPVKLASPQPTEPTTVPSDDLASDDAEKQQMEPENPTVITLQAESAKELSEEQADDPLD